MKNELNKADNFTDMQVLTSGDVTALRVRPSGEAPIPDSFDREAAEEVMRFHRTVPGYEVTELVSLKALAEKIGVRGIFVKDESSRFGLKAFKGLGGSYAVMRAVCEKLGLDPSEVTMERLRSQEIHEKIKDTVFITTTDGNHGKGVSWAAGLLGCRSYVYMPKGSVEARAQAIRDAGSAEVTVTDMGYDDTVRFTAELAEKNGWCLIQDTAWEGYEKVPEWICRGYTTMVYEIEEQLKAAAGEGEIPIPTHVFLQAGVGSMAGAVLGSLIKIYGENRPLIGIVEPEEVCCFYESAEAGDGAPHRATGKEITIMAGLNCGQPCSLIWPLIRDHADCYFRVSDDVTRLGMRTLAHPCGGDKSIVSGESGAVTLGLTVKILTELPEIRKALGMDENSVILVISTEGDTDPEDYAAVTGE